MLARIRGLARLRVRSPLVPAGRLEGPVYPLIAQCLARVDADAAALAEIAASVPAVLATAEAVLVRLWRDHIENAHIRAAGPDPTLARTRIRLAFALGELSAYCGMFAARPAHAAIHRRLCAAIGALRETIQGAGIAGEAWTGLQKMGTPATVSAD